MCCILNTFIFYKVFFSIQKSSNTNDISEYDSVPETSTNVLLLILHDYTQM